MSSQQGSRRSPLAGRTIGLLCVGGDWACAHGDFAALRHIAQQLAIAFVEPLHCELVELADACVGRPELAGQLWHELRDRIYPASCA